MLSPEATDDRAQVQYFFACPEGGYFPRDACTYELTYSLTQLFNALAEAFCPPTKMTQAVVHAANANANFIDYSYSADRYYTAIQPFIDNKLRM
jgi:hypothetical protein